MTNDPNIKGFTAPNHGDLSNWAKQGVLMLNTLLTVEEDKPESHKKSGWNDFTDFVIKTINEQCDSVIFLLWGAPSFKKAGFVDSTK